MLTSGLKLKIKKNRKSRKLLIVSHTLGSSIYLHFSTLSRTYRFTSNNVIVSKPTPVKSKLENNWGIDVVSKIISNLPTKIPACKPRPLSPWRSKCKINYTLQENAHPCSSTIQEGIHMVVIKTYTNIYKPFRLASVGCLWTTYGYTSGILTTTINIGVLGKMVLMMKDANFILFSMLKNQVPLDLLLGEEIITQTLRSDKRKKQPTPSSVSQCYHELSSQSTQQLQQ